MSEAAADRMLITMRCNACHRVTHFWAVDLVKVLGGNHQAHIPPWPCSRCRTAEFINMTWIVPSSLMLDGLTVRRPVRKIERWIWRDEKT